ncbi:hypothetical protein HWV62_33011 [Athelia sp. TMB]|nr:hypothetical protein HWV62_33011 [Athelia sp. TMB]
MHVQRAGRSDASPAQAQILMRHGSSAVQRRPPPHQPGLSHDHDPQPTPTVDALPVDVEGGDVSRFSRHLNEQFAPLSWPDELARRVLTHGSHKASTVDGHNARLAFLGRRVMHTYTSLFLLSSPALNASHDVELIASRALNTYALGQHVAPRMHLGRALRWRPTVNPEVSKRAQFKFPTPAPGQADAPQVLDPELAAALHSHPALMRSTGLYKVMGECVQAVIGGAYHQFGGAVALKLFHTRVLNNLLLSGRGTMATGTGGLGLHGDFHADAFNKAQEMERAGLLGEKRAEA